MTTTQATQYAKAIIRAAKAGLHVAGKGTIKATGQRFIAVTSATGPACHLVRIAGDTLVCDCKAAANGQYCMHRAVARARLAATVPPAAPVAADRSAATALPQRPPAGPRMFR